jgi:hypothetical protein
MERHQGDGAVCREGRLATTLLIAATVDAIEQNQADVEAPWRFR